MLRKTTALLLVLLLAAAAPGRAAARPGECTCVLCRSVAGGLSPPTDGLSERPEAQGLRQALSRRRPPPTGVTAAAWVRLPRTLF